MKEFDTNEDAQSDEPHRVLMFAAAASLLTVSAVALGVTVEAIAGDFAHSAGKGYSELGSARASLRPTDESIGMTYTLPAPMGNSSPVKKTQESVRPASPLVEAATGPTVKDYATELSLVAVAAGAMWGGYTYYKYTKLQQQKSHETVSDLSVDEIIDFKDMRDRYFHHIPQVRLKDV